MDIFKFNFLSRGQLESLGLDKFFLPFFIQAMRFLPLLLECSAEIILIWFRIEFDTLYVIKRGLYDKNDGMKKIGNKIYLEDLKGEN